MGGGGSTLLPAPDDRLMKCIKLLELSNTDLAKVFALFVKHDTAQRGCLTLPNVYKMLSERKSIFGDSVFELLGKHEAMLIMVLYPSPRILWQFSWTVAIWIYQFMHLSLPMRVSPHV